MKCWRWPMRQAMDDPERRDEPYRRALSAITARLTATLAGLNGADAAASDATGFAPYATPQELRADLVALAHSLSRGGARLLASGGALGRLIRTVEACGFHLATIDLRQNSDVHGRVVAELLQGRGRDRRLPRARGSRARGAAAPRAGQQSPAVQSLYRLQRRGAARNWPSRMPRPARSSAMAAPASPPTSSPSAKASRTCSR